MSKVTVHAFAKTNDQEVRFSASEYHAKMYVDLQRESPCLWIWCRNCERGLSVWMKY